MSRLEFIRLDLDFSNKTEFDREFSKEAARLFKEIEGREIVIDSFLLSDFDDKFRQMTEAFIEEMFGYKPNKKNITEIIKYIHAFYIRKGCDSGFKSGVVFLGFGKREIYPRVLEHFFDGRFVDKIRSWSGRRVAVSPELKDSGVIISFAQSDMTSLFMEGIAPNYVSFYTHSLRGILEEKTKALVEKLVSDNDERVVESEIQRRENEKILEALQKAFIRMRQMEVINPLVGSIRALPRDEMTAMAEAFVELTSMRRKVDSNLQTVGGPVDVAFISKTDGLVWIKRKQYFDISMNRDFIDRRKTLAEGLAT